MAYSCKTGPGALAKFREMQEKNSQKSLKFWKPRVIPNQQGQRELIARSIGNKFVKIHLMSQLEMRIANGELGRPVSAPAGLQANNLDGRASEFPPLSEHAKIDGGSESAFCNIDGPNGKSLRSNKKSVRVMTGYKSPKIQRQDTLTKWKNYDRQEKKENEIIYRDDSTRPLSASNKRREFKNILTTSSNFVEDGLLAKSISHQITMESRDSKSVYLALKKALSTSVEFTLCSDAYNTRQPLEMRDRAKNDGRSLGIAIIVDPSVVTTGMKVVLRVRYRYDSRYDRTHTASNIYAPENSAGRRTLSRTSSFNGKGLIGSKSRKSMIKFNSQAKIGEVGSGQKEEGEIVEVDYLINSSRKHRYDMKLKLDNRVESSPVVNGESMFLPGWEATTPLFIPSNHVVCQVLVTRDNSSHDNDPVGGFSPMKGGISDISDASDRARRPSNPAPNHAFGLGMKIPGLAFPCESPMAALRVLKKVSSEVLKLKTAKLMVKGNLPALHVAALHGNIAALTELMEHGADVNLASPPPMNTSALHEAVMGGKVEAIRFLLDMKANDRSIDYNGNTPLHLAVALDDIECMMPLLRSRGAMKVLTSKNGKGKTPYDLAKTNSTRACLEKGMKALHMVVSRRERIV